jgi:benzoate membrane transport protein
MVAESGGFYLANALIGFLFAASGPVAIILAVGARGGLSEANMSSWIFGSFFINGLITVLFCTLYRQPLVFFWTIPGTVLVGQALGHLRWAEVIGAFLATGLLMLVLGLSDWVRRAMQAVPMPIVMGMVAGVFLRFGLGLVYAVRDDFWIAAPMIVAFLALGASALWSRRLPPLIGALLADAAATGILGKFHSHG